MLDRIGHGSPLCRRRSIEPLALSLDYPGGRADIWLARLSAPARDLGPRRAALARRLVAWRARRPQDEVVIAHDAEGAPRIVAPTGALRLSLAGRDDLVAAAVADGPIGVDVETIGAPFVFPRNVLHPAECAALDAAGPEAHEEFLRIWTAKEAYVKALGTGFSREPARIEVRPPALSGFGQADDIEIFDGGRRVSTARARAGLVGLRGPVMLACIVLPR